MRALLDVNVLIALFDSDHSLHTGALEWFRNYGRDGWASCPITQNGCVRIMSHPNYPNALPVLIVAQRLAEAAGDTTHEFWPDDISLLNAQVFDHTRMHGPKALTDLYLLALAVEHRGRFITFNRSIAIDAVRGAQPQQLVTL